MKLNESYLALIMLIGAGPAVCPAQDFSADVVFMDGSVNAA